MPRRRCWSSHRPPHSPSAASTPSSDTALLRTVAFTIAALVLAQHLHAQDAPSSQTQSEQEHIPPAPPATQVDHPLSYREMARAMEMDDRSTVGKVMLDRLEWRGAGGGGAFAWNADAWFGTDYDKVWLKTEGERRGGETESARTEILWNRTFSRWWNLQTGLRHDDVTGASRNWAALGLQGLAPGFFDVEATLYVAEEGRAAARFAAERDLLFTQRLILQPELELNAYSKDDLARGVGAGLSDLELGLRLRYEHRRKLAAYVGIVWARRFGATASLLRSMGDDPNEVQGVAGFRAWF